MKLSSMKTKIVALLVTVGVILGCFVAFYTPHQATSLGTKILINDTRFIAKLLSENLSLGMQTMFFDDGASLEQTLSLLKMNESSEESAITNVWVYDKDLKLVANLKDQGSHAARLSKGSEFNLTDEENNVLAWSPLYDAENTLIGYVDIEFSKAFLQEAASQTTFTALLISAILIGIVLLVGLYFGTKMAKPISQLATIAESVSMGDINCKIDITSNDEVGVLATSFRRLINYMQELSDVAEQVAANDLTKSVEPKSDKDVLGNSFKTMITNLSSMVHQIKDNAIKLANAANEISSSSEQMSKGTRDQTDQVSEVSKAIDRMTAIVLESFENTGKATEASKSASETASTGGQLVSDTVIGMQKISDVVSESAASISSLAKSADQIGEIIGVINDIADQTNLLALNAAIEAARAGEQGRGFAVVADEVRKLAERTGNATGEITNMIKGIQVETEKAVNSMESGIQEVDKGRDLADKAGNSLNEIVNMSQRVMEMIQEMAAASEEQSDAAEQISKNIEYISSITRQTATGAEQSSTAAEELTRQAVGMKEMVAQFKLAKNSY